MNSLTKSAISVAALLVVSKSLGFLREICLAYSFGTSYITDVYSAAIMFPNVLFALYASGYAEAYVVIYSRLETEQRRRENLNNLLTILICVAFVFSLICFCASSFAARLIAPGFSQEAVSLLTLFVQVLSLMLPQMIVINILSAHMQAREDFLFVNFCNAIVVNLIVIGSIVFAKKHSYLFLAIGYVFAHAVVAAMLVVYAKKKHKITYTARFCLRDRAFTDLSKLAIPLGGSLLVSELNGMADRMFASLLGEGVISALSYSSKVQIIFYSLTTSVFISVCYPRINRYFAEADYENGMYYIRKAVLTTAYLSVPVAAGLFFFSEPVISLLFERGMFSENSTTMTAECLAFYALGLPFYALREVGARALGAKMEQKKVLRNTSIAVLCNVSFNLLFLNVLRHIGLALATSLSGIIATVLAFHSLSGLGLHTFDRQMLTDLLKVVEATAMSILACSFTFNVVQRCGGQSLAIVIGVCVAVAVYLIVSILLRIDIFIWIYQHLPQKVKIIPEDRFKSNF